MKIRTRVSLLLAASLIVAIVATLLIGLVAFQHTRYQTWDSYRTALLEEFDISNKTAIRELKDHPELFFEASGKVTNGRTGKTLDQAAQAVQHNAANRAVAQSRRWMLLALAAVTAAALLVGWLLTGRILRPIRLMTQQARAASEFDLSARVSLSGPNDEMKELADTFDTMLDRLQRSFDTQRQFSAQVAHELRTPLALTNSEVEMLLADVDEPALRTPLQAIAEATRRAERLVSRLLVLSRTDTRDLDRTPFAFDELVGNVVGRAVESASWHGLRADLELRPARVIGDRALLESLVRNLVENAGRYNRANGWVKVVVKPCAENGTATLEVSNSIDTDTDTEGLADEDRPPGTPHVGLAIVAAVLDAHGGTITWHRDAQSVTAEVMLPAATRASALAV